MSPNKGVLDSLVKTEIFSCDETDSFLQSGFWGGFKAKFGWEPMAFKAGWKVNDQQEQQIETKHLLVHYRKLAPFFAIAYVPWGPELPESITDKEEALKDLAFSLKELLPKNTVFLRFDPNWNTDSGSLKPPFIHSSADIQPPSTVVLDLSKSMETLTEEMKPKWRYNARLAIKRGVTVRQADASEIGSFYALLKETARRDGISVHDEFYYRRLFENDWYEGKKPELRLYLADFSGDLLAGIVTLFRGKNAYYLYGASSNQKRNLMAPYALQLEAIKDAKNSGCLNYDLFGIPPENDPSHPMFGLYLFKTGFGGKIVHNLGSWDFPLQPLIYRLFRFAESSRKKLRDIKKQRH